MAKKLKKKHTSIIPVDVLQTILSRLPVKSLIRFKFVSRSWQAIISDPRFSKIFSFQQSKSQKYLFFIRRRKRSRWPCGSYALIEFENNKFRTQSELENPIGDWIPECSCNGMVLLRTPGNSVYTLWNPSIRKYTRIWLEDFGFHEGCSYGLYHDSRIDDYKIVVISWKHYTIFSCKSGTWAEKKPTPGSGLLPPVGVFVDGSFYWWVYRERKLMSFDVASEEFKTLQPPNDPKADYSVRLIILSGRLCLYDSSDRERTTKLQLWVMEKHAGDDENYSWRELMNAEKDKPHPFIYGPICLTNEDNVVISLKGSNYVMYNHCEKRFEESWKDLSLCKLLLCSESLVFPIQNIKDGSKRDGD